MTSAFRCSAASRDTGESMAGTASTVRAFLLLEDPGPWGADVLRDSRLPEPVRHWLAGLERRHGVRPLLVRRHGSRTRGAVPTPRVFLASVRPEGSRFESAVLDDVRDVVDLDVAALAAGAPTGLSPADGPTFLVCTHGRHDACCAETGRPLAAALTRVAPDRTWEVSHIGGDRFAANALVLPHGLYYGRLQPDDAPGLVEAHLAGRLELSNLRGRSCFSFAAQVAEIHLRRHVGDDGAAPPDLLDVHRDGPLTRVVLGLGGRRWEVTVRTGRSQARQLTCAGVPSRALEHAVVDLSPL